MLEPVVREFFTSDTFVDDYEDGVQQFGRVLQNIEDPDIFLADLNTLLEGDTISTTTLNMASYDEFDSILVGLDRLLHIRKEGDIGPFLEHLNFDWLVSVWGGEPLDVRMLYNGRILLRNHTSCTRTRLRQCHRRI